MEFLANNWETIMVLLNTIGLGIVAKYKTGAKK